MKKFLALSVASSVVLTSCTVTNDTTSSTNSSNDNMTTLKTVSMFGGTDPSAEHYNNLIASFEEKNPDVKVEDYSAVSDETWKIGVLADFEVGNEPDVILYFTGIDAEPIIETDKVVTIEEIKEMYPDYAEDVTDMAMSYMVEPNGNSYAVPFRGFWEGLFVNEDLFNEYDLELPTTWENFETAINTFSETDIIPVAVSFSDVPHYWIEHLVLTMGGVEDHKMVLSADEEVPQSWIDAFQLFYDLNEMGAFAPDATATNNEAVGQLFKNKQAAMMIDGSWFAGGIEDKDMTTVLPFPAHTDGKKDPTSIIGGFSSGFYITRKAWDDPEKREAAVNFVKEMTSREAIAGFAKTGGAPAAIIDTPDDLSNLDASGLKLATNAKNADMAIDSRLPKEAWNYIVSNVSNIVDGSMSAEDVLMRAAELSK